MKIVVMGGGTGTSTLLRGLRSYDFDLKAVISMSDSLGSSGMLKKELNLLPFGDLRQCIFALAENQELVKDLDFRFNQGKLKGHNLGNLMLAGLTQSHKSIEEAISIISEMVKTKGKVLPVTLDMHEIKMELANGKTLNGSGEIINSKETLKGYKKFYTEPKIKATQSALKAIKDANLIILAPGGLYYSLFAVLAPRGIREELLNSSGKKVFVGNLVTRKGHTDKFKISAYLEELAKFIGADIFDKIIVNDTYSNDAEYVINDLNDDRIISANLVGPKKVMQKGDLIPRNNFVHDSKKIGEIIYNECRDI